MVLTVSEFIGHLHPVLVHLPIGILLLAGLFLCLSGKEKFRYLQSSVPVILLMGAITALLTCITGYILSGSGEYDENLVRLHQWMGIGVALLAFLTFLLNRKNKPFRWQVFSAALLICLILIAGHLGGSLTHGPDYLTKPLNFSGDTVLARIKRKPIPDIQQAWAYADVVEPIFREKCYDCHSATRQKGKLRLDQADLIIKGGKDGAVIVPGNAGESELIKRILSSREEEHHMPPREKLQLSDKETLLLQWWVNQGADFTRKVKDLQQPEKIKSLLTGLQHAPEEKKSPSFIPAGTVEEADVQAIRSLRDRGVVVLPVAENSHFLSASFITATDFTDKDIHLLLPLKNQLVWLKMGHTAITDSALPDIARCIQLITLQLDHTNITDRGIIFLTSLENLQSLNLVATKITAAGLLRLAPLKKLQYLYLYQTGFDKKRWSELQKTFPNTILDSGGYRLPYIKTDTQTVKSPKVVY